MTSNVPSPRVETRPSKRGSSGAPFVLAKTLTGLLTLCVPAPRLLHPSPNLALAKRSQTIIFERKQHACGGKAISKHASYTQNMGTWPVSI